MTYAALGISGLLLIPGIVLSVLGARSMHHQAQLRKLMTDLDLHVHNRKMEFMEECLRTSTSSIALEGDAATTPVNINTVPEYAWQQCEARWRSRGDEILMDDRAYQGKIEAYDAMYEHHIGHVHNGNMFSAWGVVLSVVGGGFLVFGIIGLSSRRERVLPPYSIAHSHSSALAPGDAPPAHQPHHAYSA